MIWDGNPVNPGKLPSLLLIRTCTTDMRPHQHEAQGKSLSNSAIMISHTCCHLNGLRMKWSRVPVQVSLTLSSARRRAEQKMKAGISRDSFDDISNAWRYSSSPSRSGMFKSVITRSHCVLQRTSRASTPFVTVVKEYCGSCMARLVHTVSSALRRPQRSGCVSCP
jgi:hypothetical protein